MTSTNVTKVALRARCQQILARGAHRVSEVDALFLLTDVFPKHEHWHDKRGAGVSHVEVRVHGEYRTKGFFLVRTDGTAVDISYRVALDGATPFARFTAAARYEVFGQISAWKAANPAPADRMHCDHVVPFDTLVRRWLASVGLSQEEVIVSSQRVGHHDLFSSRDLALSWQRFHRQHATYQWLAAGENIAKSNHEPGATTPVTADEPGHDGWLRDYNNEDARLTRAGEVA